MVTPLLSVEVENVKAARKDTVSKRIEAQPEPGLARVYSSQYDTQHATLKLLTNPSFLVVEVVRLAETLDCDESSFGRPVELLVTKMQTRSVMASLRSCWDRGRKEAIGVCDRERAAVAREFLLASPRHTSVRFLYISPPIRLRVRNNCTVPTESLNPCGGARYRTRHVKSEVGTVMQQVAWLYRTRITAKDLAVATSGGNGGRVRRRNGDVAVDVHRVARAEVGDSRGPGHIISITET